MLCVIYFIELSENDLVHFIVLDIIRNSGENGHLGLSFPMCLMPAEQKRKPRKDCRKSPAVKHGEIIPMQMKKRVRASEVSIQSHIWHLWASGLCPGSSCQCALCTGHSTLLCSCHNGSLGQFRIHLKERVAKHTLCASRLAIAWDVTSCQWIAGVMHVNCLQNADPRLEKILSIGAILENIPISNALLGGQDTASLEFTNTVKS